MQQFQEEVKLFLTRQVRDSEVQVSHENLDLLSIAHAKWPYEVLLVFHRLGESEAAHVEKISRFHPTPKLKVVHFWEDLWNFHCEKVKSRLLSLLGKSHRIHGRACAFKAINNNELVAFLSDNHLNAPIKAKYKYGLFHEEMLVAVMSFSKSRIIDRGGKNYNSYELLRFCNKLNHTVVGGFSKLLGHFVTLQRPDDIMTYVDKDWSDGQAYQKAGFAMVDQMPPMFFWLNIETGQRIYPGKNDVGKPMIRREIEKSRENNKFLKVFNSGSYKFIRINVV
jgi:hypothetical protein